LDVSFKLSQQVKVMYAQNIIHYTVWYQIFFEVWLVISRRFCVESVGKIGLSRHDFEKIEVKCAKKGDFEQISN